MDRSQDWGVIIFGARRKLLSHEYAPRSRMYRRRYYLCRYRVRGEECAAIVPVNEESGCEDGQLRFPHDDELHVRRRCSPSSPSLEWTTRVASSSAYVRASRRVRDLPAALAAKMDERLPAKRNPSAVLPLLRGSGSHPPINPPPPCPFTFFSYCRSLSPTPPTSPPPVCLFFLSFSLSFCTAGVAVSRCDFL